MEQCSRTVSMRFDVRRAVQSLLALRCSGTCARACSWLLGPGTGKEMTSPIESVGSTRHNANKGALHQISHL